MIKDQLVKCLSALRQQGSLVHSITNYVVMNNTANALLAIGASPIMAHSHSEIDEMVSISGALVVNIGTLDEYWVKSMELAIGKARELNKPWILDPVGAGATSFRNAMLKKLIDLHAPTVIRGNASEIMALANMHSKTKGVDSIHQSNEAVEAARLLSKSTGSVVCVSGEVDFVIKGNRMISIENGHSLMPKVTGMGCTATALVGAFCAANPEIPFEATAAAMVTMGIAGEIAAEISNGPGSLQVNFIDALYQFSPEIMLEEMKLTEHYE
ncbi:hydroxyethylthiazole kinase [Solitalea canadensis]|uniref:Hydroxyethylthiazole kinase n=1 Tax=Solitalea canadensis (strain ATCC 29591 / DSM 3403 / JCM 21819 / LMG 8368 / NBRC 15130 / NCIMB 12057 / USAM 9D) TaxID=929556 RepID=H8KKZ5_SOLCM|nr:hydroxyethylthiazole kinase [Solitalea canadensis]AFD08812.1 hydroxyethylthiazole kinase [Solitalea canadensis DSM 3403]